MDFTDFCFYSDFKNKALQSENAELCQRKGQECVCLFKTLVFCEEDYAIYFVTIDENHTYTEELITCAGSWEDMYNIFLNFEKLLNTTIKLAKEQ